MRLLTALLILISISNPLWAEELTGIIVGKYANVRTTPTVVNSQIITRAYMGTAIKILDKTQEKTEIEDISGYWYKIKLIESNKQGWVFDKYVVLEGSLIIQEHFQTVLSRLYYFRTDLTDQIESLKGKLNRKNALDVLVHQDSRFFNYIGYHLLAERNVLAIPLLISFMDPQFASENSQDANYNFTWEILERLTPRQLITSDYKSFRYWWQNNRSSISIDIPAYELSTIFKKIQDNENKIYRKLPK